MAEVRTRIELETQALDDALKSVGGSVENIIDTIERLQDKQQEQADLESQLRRGQERALTQLNRKTEEVSDNMLQKLNRLSGWYESFLSDIKKEGGIAAALGEGLPQQLTGIKGAIGQVKQSVFSELPFGGILGLIFYGLTRRENVRVAGAEVARAFQQVGEVGVREMGKVSGIIDDLGMKLGKGPTGMQSEVAATANMFASAGISIHAALQKQTVDFEHMGNTMIETAIAADSLFKTAGGTAAKNMATLVRQYNVEFQKSGDLIFKIGFLARDTGTGVTAFTQSIMRSSSSLRIFRLEAGDLVKQVATVQASIARSLRERMGISVGDPRAAFAAEYAERATGQITQAFARMDLGLASVIGQRVAAARPDIAPEGMTGLQAGYQMRFGFQQLGKERGEKPTETFIEGLNQTIKLVQEQAGGGPEAREKQMLMFEQLLGVSLDTARVMADMGGDITSSENIQKLTKQQVKEQKESLTGRMSEANRWQRKIHNIQRALSEIGLSTLGAIINGFKMMGSYLEYFRNLLGTSILFGGTEAQRAASGRKAARAEVDIEEMLLINDAHAKRVMRNMETIGNIAGGTVKEIMGMGGKGVFSKETRAAKIAAAGRRLPSAEAAGMAALETGFGMTPIGTAAKLLGIGEGAGSEQGEPIAKRARLRAAGIPGFEGPADIPGPGGGTIKGTLEWVPPQGLPEPPP